jgi:peptidoglycan-N-acetylglucosamine deacetylase
MFGALAGVAGAAALVAAGYQTMSPTGQWYGRAFSGLPGGVRKLALTFDDGPNDACTLKLLEVLDKHAVHATFFMIGRFVRQWPDLADAVFRAGHAIGNHTFNHPNLIFASSQQTRKEIVECQRGLRDLIGHDPVLFRPPWGARRPGTLQIARSLGLAPIMWNITGYDWRGQSADVIVSKVCSRIRGGDVILLHDGSHLGTGADRSRTVTAVDQIIATCKSQGYEFQTVPEMIRTSGRRLTA